MSERLGSVGLGVSVVPLLVFVCVPWVTIFGVSSCSSFNPWVLSTSMLVLAVLIGVADVVSMLGAVVGDLKPFLAIGVNFADPGVLATAMGIVTTGGGGRRSELAAAGHSLQCFDSVLEGCSFRVELLL